MKHYMTIYNGHNKELVGKINDLFNDGDRICKNAIIALRAICELCSDECREKFGFVPINEADIIDNADEILMNICDDTDLQVILMFCRK